MKKRLIPSLLTISVVLPSAFFLFSPSKKQIDLTIIGRVNLADSIARQPADLIEALCEDLTISFLSTGNNDLTGLSANAKKIIKNPQKQPFGKIVLYEEILSLPNCETTIPKLLPGKEPDRIYIAYSMFESSSIPDNWGPILNTYFDLVVVPDPFLVEVYENSGVTIPIFVLPLGLNLQRWLSAPLHQKRNGPFVFGNLSAGIDRKNHLTLLKGFHRAFGNRKDVQLLINTRYCSYRVKRELIQEIREHNLTNVTFTQHHYDADRYFTLFNQIDCYVSLSKAEGYSIQPREAMALGIPVIATNNTAQTTICNTGLVHGVDTPLVEQAFFEVYDCEIGEYANCSVEATAKALLDVYENYSDYLQKADDARQWAATSDFSHLRPYYLSLLYPKKVSLGSENQITPDEITTNSVELFDKLSYVMKR